MISPAARFRPGFTAWRTRFGSPLSPREYATTSRLHGRNKPEPHTPLFTDEAQGVPRAAYSPTAAKVARRILWGGAHPLSVLREGLARENLEIESVRLCLDIYQTQHLVHMKRSERLTKLRSEGVGALTLQWAWNEDNRWARVLCREPLLLECLAFFLAAEGKDGFLISLLKLDKPTNGGHVPQNAAWRGCLLRVLIKAHFDLSLGTSADSILDFYFALHGEILALRRGTKRHSDDRFFGTSLRPAMMELTASICDWPRTSSSLYQEVVEKMPLVLRNESRNTHTSNSDWSRATLALYHPSAPSCQPLLRLLRSTFGNLTGDEIRQRVPPEASKKARLYYNYQRMEQVLDAENPEEAEWVRGLRKHSFDADDLKIIRRKWVSKLKSFGVADPGGDLETIVTWDPDSYWMRARDEEHRAFESKVPKTQPGSGAPVP